MADYVVYFEHSAIKRLILCIWLGLELELNTGTPNRLHFLFLHKGWSSDCLLFVLKWQKTSKEHTRSMWSALQSQRMQAEQNWRQENKKQPQYHFCRDRLVCRISFCIVQSHHVQLMLNVCLNPLKNSGIALTKRRPQERLNAIETGHNKVKANEWNINSVVHSIERMLRRRQQLSQCVVCCNHKNKK